MKKVIKTTGLFVALAAVAFSISSFKGKKAATDAGYAIQLVSKEQSGTSEIWTWTVTNPNPGNGQNGTYQDVSHWSVPLSAAAESALLGAEYSYDGVTWYSVSTTIERDPSIRQCTGTDVLKFDVGTTGDQPTYYRVIMSETFTVNNFAYSYIKTGGGLKGCNLYVFAGIGAPTGGN